MKSFLREILIELVSSSSALILELLRPHGDFGHLEGLPSEAFTVEIVSAPDHHPDHVRLFRDAAGTPVFAAIVDVQQHIDSRKPWIWPIYLTATVAALRCPAVLLVLAPDPHVARWVRSPASDSECRLSTLVKPLVVSYRDVPRVVDGAVARRMPELALLSALAHPGGEVVRAAAAGLASMEDRTLALRLLAAVRAALPESLRAELKMAAAKTVGAEKDAAAPGAGSSAAPGAGSSAAPGAGNSAAPGAASSAAQDAASNASPGSPARGARRPAAAGRIPMTELYPQEMQDTLHTITRTRLGKLSRDEAMAVEVAASDDDAAIRLITGLALARDVQEARDAIHRAATDFLHGWCSSC